MVFHHIAKLTDEVKDPEVKNRAGLANSDSSLSGFSA
jgi:hypothetical protein